MEKCMIGHKYSGILLLSIMSVSAGMSDQPATGVLKPKVINTKSHSVVESVEQRVVADAWKNIQEVRQNSTSSLERVVCSYSPQSVSVRAYFNEYHRKSEVVKTGDAALLATRKASASDVTKVVVTHLDHDPDKLCITSYRPNGERVESKEVLCNNIKIA